MTESDDDQQATQQTREGQTIPVPQRDDVFRDLARVAGKARCLYSQGIIATKADQEAS